MDVPREYGQHRRDVAYGEVIVTLLDKPFVLRGDRRFQGDAVVMRRRSGCPNREPARGWPLRLRTVLKLYLLATQREMRCR